jgi:hypothetical protein
VQSWNRGASEKGIYTTRTGLGCHDCFDRELAAGTTGRQKHGRSVVSEPGVQGKRMGGVALGGGGIGCDWTFF